MARPRISGFLSEEQRHSLSNFPEFIDQSDVIKYFFLADGDKEILLAQSENVTHFSKWKMSPLLH